MKETKVKGSQISDELYARYYLLHIFADVFANFAGELQKCLDAERLKYTQELKHNMNQLLEHTRKQRYYANKVACDMVEQFASSDSALNDMFRNSDSISELFMLIIDRVMSGQDKGVIRRLEAYLREHFSSTGLYPELGTDKDVERRMRDGSVCDMVLSCPYFNSTAKTVGGNSYSIYYCRGMFKDCKRRKARVAGGPYKNMTPDGAWQNDADLQKIKMVVPKFVF